MVHTLAEQHGMVATFMPKPFTNLTGNGCHFHMSLWRDGENAFLDEADARGLGLSGTAYHFLGGLKAHARAYARADRADGELVQAAEARRRRERGDLVAGLDLVRLQQPHADAAHPGAGRIEDRTVDGSANPYLAAAAVLAAGLDGIERELDPGEPNSENLYAQSYDELTTLGLRSLPANLLEAIDELERDDVLRAALGRGRGEDYVDYYARVKRDEWFRYHEQVTPGSSRST